MRLYFIHQLLLDDASPLIHSELSSAIALVEKDLDYLNDPALKILFNLEKIQIYLQLYSQVSKAEPVIDSVLEDLQLQAVLVGMLVFLLVADLRQKA